MASLGASPRSVEAPVGAGAARRGGQRRRNRSSSAGLEGSSRASLGSGAAAGEQPGGEGNGLAGAEKRPRRGEGEELVEKGTAAAAGQWVGFTSRGWWAPGVGEGG